MEKIYHRLIFKIATLLFLAPQFVSAQSDFRTITSGDWELASTWEVFNGATWVPAVAAPTSADGVITIRNTHTIAVNGSLTIDQTVIEGGGYVNFYSGNLTVANGSGIDLVINGELLNGSCGRDGKKSSDVVFTSRS